MSGVTQKRNTVQISLMRLFDRQMNQRELDEVHRLLMNYYDKLVGDEADKVMKEKGYTQADLDAILNKQQRTNKNQ